MWESLYHLLEALWRRVESVVVFSRARERDGEAASLLAQNAESDEHTRRRLTFTRDALRPLLAAASELEALRERFARAFAQNDGEEGEAILSRTGALLDSLEARETEALLGGPYDGHAAFLLVYPCDPLKFRKRSTEWRQRLVRMYRNWAQRQGLEVRDPLRDTTLCIHGMHQDHISTDASLLEIWGPGAFGYARVEAGVHQLGEEVSCRVEVFPSLEEREWRLTRNDLVFELREGRAGAYTVYLLRDQSSTIYCGAQDILAEQNTELLLKLFRGKLALASLSDAPPQDAFIRLYLDSPQNFVWDRRTGKVLAGLEEILAGDLESLIRACLRKPLGPLLRQSTGK